MMLTSCTISSQAQVIFVKKPAMDRFKRRHKILAGFLNAIKISVSGQTWWVWVRVFHVAEPSHIRAIGRDYCLSTLLFGSFN